MERLKTLVSNLEKLGENDKDDAVIILKQINEQLLTEYVIKVDDVIIEPLLVEAYYYHPGKFEDKNTHGYRNERCRKMQSNRFGQLYFHRKGYGGLDLCLSMGDDYCLSFLIKNSLVSHVGFCTQTKLSEQLTKTKTREEMERIQNVLCKKHRDFEIIHTVRKGLASESFKNELLASLPIDKIKDYPFTLEKEHSRTILINAYLKKEARNTTHTRTRDELSELAKNYMPRKEFDKLFPRSGRK